MKVSNFNSVCECWFPLCCIWILLWPCWTIRHILLSHRFSGWTVYGANFHLDFLGSRSIQIYLLNIKRMKGVVALIPIISNWICYLFTHFGFCYWFKSRNLLWLTLSKCDIVRYTSQVYWIYCFYPFEFFSVINRNYLQELLAAAADDDDDDHDDELVL